MKLGLMVEYAARGMDLPIERIKRCEALGYDSVWTAEAYGTDAITPLAFIAAHTKRIRLATGVIQLSARTPAMTAMQLGTLDALAREGVLFSDCVATSNITLPSHAALLTGVHPRDTSITNNRTRLGGQADTLAGRFQAAGYATLAVTSAKHMNHPWSGLGQGFDRMAWPSVERDRSAPESVALLREWMQEYRDQPLFIWLHLYDAHRPYEPPALHTLHHYPTERDPRSDSLPLPNGPLPPHLKGVRDLDYVRALYQGEVSHLDAELGALLAHERMAQAIVAVTGDHGESLGEQGLWWDHVSLYPSVLHVPLLLRWPGGPEERRVGKECRSRRSTNH